MGGGTDSSVRPMEFQLHHLICLWPKVNYLPSPNLIFLIYVTEGRVIGFSQGLELDCEESWVPKNWCIWTVVLEKTLENPLDCTEIQPAHSEGDQPWVFFGPNDAKAETPILWPPHMKSWLWKWLWCWEGLGAGGEGHDRGWDGWMAHWLNGCESEWTPGVGAGQGGLVCCSSWGCKESDMIEPLNRTELVILSFWKCSLNYLFSN